MVQILTVCTGNICRSPLAELILAERLRDLDVSVASAGVRALVGHEMTPEAQDLATAQSVSAAHASAHRARYLTEDMLTSADLVVGMAREHRRGAVELAPGRLKVTFTAREFGRLAETLDDDAIAAAAGAETDPRMRLRRAIDLVAANRFTQDPPADPNDDDVVDPYLMPWSTYEASSAQLVPAVNHVARVVRAALT